jgi:hypothetical protein
MGLQADYAWMPIERKNSPVAEMLVHRDENPAFVDCSAKDFGIVCRFLAGFGRAQNLMPLRPKECCQIEPEHLVQVQSHRRSSHASRNDLSMFHRCLGKENCRLNVLSDQPRITGQQRLPGFAGGKLVEEDGDGDAGSLDDRRSAATSRVDFYAVEHVKPSSLSVFAGPPLVKSPYCAADLLPFGEPAIDSPFGKGRAAIV